MMALLGRVISILMHCPKHCTVMQSDLSRRRRIDSMVAQGGAAMSDLMLLSGARMRRNKTYLVCSVES